MRVAFESARLTARELGRRLPLHGLEPIIDQPAAAAAGRPAAGGEEPW